MCIGNQADNVTYWVNQQLATLWKISVGCVETHGHGIKPCKPEIAHGTCLAQVCVGKHKSKPSKDDLLFFSAFEAPEIQFICNHDVLLIFRLKSGHFRNNSRSSIESFQGYTCAFRVPFRQHLITDTTYFNCGQTDACKARFLILDLNAAEIVREKSMFAAGHNWGFDEVDRKQKMIIKYLRAEYLPLLRRGGFHFIHSLPDFDILTRTHHIDWSVVTKLDIETLSVCGVNIEVINTFLRGRWLEASGCVDELEDDHDHSCFRDFALAEHRGACDDFHFHAFFGPPQVRALCSKEVVFFIDVRELHIYVEGGFKGEAQDKFSNWTIAIVGEVAFVEEEEGNVRRLKMDFNKARFCKGLSSFGEDCEFEVIKEAFFWKMFIRYICTRYLFILQESEHDHIYRLDIRVVEEEEYIEEGAEDFEFVEEEFRERLCITDTFGFDILTAVTQASINCHFRCLWKASQSSNSCLSGWSLEENFEASFGPIQIQLPSDSCSNTVIVYFTLREGALAVLDCKRRCVGGEMHGFSNWKVAFEMNLKLREYKKAHAISDGCLKDRESVGEFVNYQLVLDFETAKFRQDLSRLSGLFDDSRFHLTRSKRQALIRYITRYYFAELKMEGHHVLYTFPVWKTAGSCGFNRFAPSHFSFQFYGPYSGGEVSIPFGAQCGSGNRNMIVISGMVDKRNQCPSPLPPCTWNWSCSQDIFAGVVVLSRKVFLEGWLLRELISINGRTTLVPVFGGIGDSGEWRFDLVTWDEHSSKGGTGKCCEGKEITGKSGEIEFEHSNKEMWTYNQVGDSCDFHNGGYSISCETVNKLIIPTVSKCGGLEIKLLGKVTLKLAFKGEHKSWSSSAVARWSYTISIIGGALGCGPKIKPSKTYEVSSGSGFTGDFDIVHPRIKDASTLLNEKLRDILIIEDSAIEELRTSFCGVWPLFYSGCYGYTLCNPVFNSCGDLIFELESPLDCNGQVAVSDRGDICLPLKHHGHSRSRKAFGEDEESDVREASFSTTTTHHDDGPRTPASLHSQLHSKVIVRSSSEDDEYASEENIRRSSREQVYKSGVEKWDTGTGKVKPLKHH